MEYKPLRRRRGRALYQTVSVRVYSHTGLSWSTQSIWLEIKSVFVLIKSRKKTKENKKKEEEEEKETPEKALKQKKINNHHFEF